MLVVYSTLLMMHRMTCWTYNLAQLLRFINQRLFLTVLVNAKSHVSFVSLVILSAKNYLMHFNLTSFSTHLLSLQWSKILLSGAMSGLRMHKNALLDGLRPGLHWKLTALARPLSSLRDGRKREGDGRGEGKRGKEGGEGKKWESHTFVFQSGQVWVNWWN